MIVYLDTSVVLRVLFGQANPLPMWGTWERAYSSAMMGVEARRSIDRLRLESVLNDDGVVQAHEALKVMERRLGTLRVTQAVLQRAALPMATAVKTLDAIHLASALLLQERHVPSLTFATHDRQQAKAARALGFDVTGI